MFPFISREPHFFGDPSKNKYMMSFLSAFVNPGLLKRHGGKPKCKADISLFEYAVYYFSPSNSPG